MTNDTHRHEPQGAPGTAHIGARQVARALLSLVVLIASPFLAAGRLDWWPAWALVALTLAASVAARIIPARRNPDLLAERARFAEAEGVKPWDRVLMPIVGIVGPLAVWVVAGLDERFGWPPLVSLPLQVVGLLIVAAGGALATWAMAENRFFSAVVRIQRDRGHSVISSGLYRLVRHPGYSAGVLNAIAAPLALGSLWALIPGLLCVGAIAVRTALEDRTLQAELPGYREYAQRVRYRLLPGVW
ncbi:MAG TPA: isoprenylcysteine carboxylmethyltransferase family protein [Anaerolineae bacterium]|nr:isoprenylcysteine carboxylmethyltransferase family protein [Anaerolineae bacterium]